VDAVASGEAGWLATFYVQLLYLIQIDKRTIDKEMICCTYRCSGEEGMRGVARDICWCRALFTGPADPDPWSASQSTCAGGAPLGPLFAPRSLHNSAIYLLHAFDIVPRRPPHPGRPHVSTYGSRGSLNGSGLLACFSFALVSSIHRAIAPVFSHRVFE